MGRENKWWVTRGTGAYDLGTLRMGPGVRRAPLLAIRAGEQVHGAPPRCGRCCGRGSQSPWHC